MGREMEQLGLARHDVVLMPTAYPLHLQALADHAPSLRQAHFACGMMMPPSFWAGEAEAAPLIARILEDAVCRLQGEHSLFYTETGQYPFASATVQTPSLLPPVSGATEALMAELASAARPDGEALRVGFFGSPFTSKGYNLLVEAIQAGLPPQLRVVLRLPPGHGERCAALNAASDRVDAASGATDNAEFLRAMAAVDVVYALYDPAWYGEKMSGIIPEAICLGRPLLVSADCTALTTFLDRTAPGSFVSVSYDPGSLRAALALPASVWRDRAARAAASAPVVRALKNARRYLTAAGAGALYSERPDALAA
jgi:hypothetical protein